MSKALLNIVKIAISAKNMFYVTFCFVVAKYGTHSATITHGEYKKTIQLSHMNHGYMLFQHFIVFTSYFWQPEFCDVQ